MAAGARDDTRDMAALVTLGNRLASITTGTNMNRGSIANNTLGESDTTATRSIVRVLMRATVRCHTRVSFIHLDGSYDEESEGEAASPGTLTPELLLCSELSFVMSSSVLLPSPNHNCG
ncbi:hypothetical protein AMECASPLE_017661 [Ameca splendens]|uniref:Uncharacterized protein n=1 Tax=Ameca splendens TaxID=208324 RepID=A0ABV0Z0G9_9TELE